MSLGVVTKKLKRLISLVDNIQVVHFLYLWFFSVLGFLIVMAIATNFMTLAIDETEFGNSSLFSFLFFGFIYMGIFLFSLTLLLIFVNIFIKPTLHKIIKLALLLSIVFITGVATYQMGKSKGEGSWECEFTADETKQMCEQLGYDEQSSYAQDIPECDFNGCPEYKAIDTDGDNQYESVVYQRIAMTKGAGGVVIIDEGKVVFRAGGAQFSYEENDDMPGITVNYVKEFDETGLNPKTWAKEKWIYLGGEYVLADDYEGFCEEHLDLGADEGTVTRLEGSPKYPDYSFEPDASRFQTVINKAVDSGVNFAGHYTVATWGCGTDCFGYAVVDLLSGEVVTFSSANENYNISGLDIRGRYMILNPVMSGQDKKYYKLSEYRNYSDEIVSIFNLICTEKSTQDMYGFPE